MAKSIKDLKARVDKLKARVKKLAKRLEAARAPASAAPSGAKPGPVSPLAPASFPALPVIAGVEFAAIAAGVRYAGRSDVMLARLAPGTAIAGAFTRSSTRAACVL
ncbi:MAG: bifunctional ornithine acetyltransferase/N-acetylglutamate synthase, partial [Pseudorhodobacter sp.]|nr:bifunctional ornithine acetyltransferase/N-acetylglutamate synthase [Pseudorhodobacter sp.]